MKKSSHARSLYILTLITVLWALPLLTCANMAQPMDNPIDQTLIFNENPLVTLLEETVVFRFAENNHNCAQVEVNYRLENLLDKEQQFDVMFITPDLADAEFEVFFNNEKIIGIRLDENIGWPANWQVGKPIELIEPVSKKPLDKGSVFSWGSNFHTFSGATFPLNLKAGEITDLKVTYQSKNGYYRYEHIINTVYSQLYYLTPAKFWNGQAKVNLRIEFPETYKVAVHSNIPLEEINKNMFQTTLDGIPDDEWTFSYVDTKGLIFNTNKLLTHNLFVFLITALLLAAVPVSRRYCKKRPVTFLAALPAVAFFISTIKVTYGFMFLLYMFGPFILLIAGILLVFKIKKRAD